MLFVAKHFFLDSPQFYSATPVMVKEKLGKTVTLECSTKSVPNFQFRQLQNGFEIFENIENFIHMSRYKVSDDKWQRQKISLSFFSCQVELKSQESFQNCSCVTSNDHDETKQLFYLSESDDNHDYDGDITTELNNAFV